MDISEFISNSHCAVKVAIYCEPFSKTGKKFKIFYNIFLLGGSPLIFFKVLSIFHKVFSISKKFGKFDSKDIRNKDLTRPQMRIVDEFN